jgi:hypothetical protein
LKLSDARFANNREISRDFSDFQPRILVFCPNSAILLFRTGINREFAAFDPSHSKSVCYEQNHDGTQLNREFNREFPGNHYGETPDIFWEVIAQAERRASGSSASGFQGRKKIGTHNQAQRLIFCLSFLPMRNGRHE